MGGEPREKERRREFKGVHKEPSGFRTENNPGFSIFASVLFSTLAARKLREF